MASLTRFTFKSGDRFPAGLTGDVSVCRGPGCGEEVVFVFNPKSGRKPPYNKDGVPHFTTCVDAERFKGASKAAAR